MPGSGMTNRNITYYDKIASEMKSKLDKNNNKNTMTPKKPIKTTEKKSPVTENPLKISENPTLTDENNNIILRYLTRFIKNRETQCK